ncbi:MAG: hypothetical protein ACP5JR_07930, partial [Thermoplasmata archaeon]
MPPMITEYTVNISDENFYTVNITYNYTVKDLRGISKIRVELIDAFWNTLLAFAEYFPVGYPTEDRAEGWNHVDKGLLLLDGCKLKITVWNINWDSVSAEKTYNGILKDMADAITALGAMLLGGLQKVWEAVRSAVNAIVEWVKEQVTKVFDLLVMPLIKMIESWGEDIGKEIGMFIAEVFSGRQPVEKLAETLAHLLLGSSIILAIWAIVGGMLVAESIAKPFTASMSWIVTIL